MITGGNVLTRHIIFLCHHMKIMVAMVTKKKSQNTLLLGNLCVAINTCSLLYFDYSKSFCGRLYFKDQSKDYIAN